MPEATLQTDRGGESGLWVGYPLPTCGVQAKKEAQEAVAKAKVKSIRTPRVRSVVVLFEFASPFSGRIGGAVWRTLGETIAQKIGTTPPELKAVKWYNSPALTLEDLRERAVLIEVFRTR